MLRSTPAFLLVLAPALVSACSSDESNRAASGGSDSGGQSASGGAGPSSGSGSGGRLSTGGSPSSAGSGAGPSSGGVSPNGGRSASGGAVTTGGKSASGGSSTGGVATTGGKASASGGASATGGASVTGGSESGGGKSAGGAGTGGSGTAGNGNAGAASYAKCPDTTWKLVWGDDFEGAAGSAVDGSKWAYDTGPNWYNGELQAYTGGNTNASLDGSGNLVIEARKESREGRQYTSARLKTEGKKTFTYGRFEGRMKLPYGQGMWPALWMLGGNSWPNNGEIDIMENLGREPFIVHGTIHGPGYSGANGPGKSFTLPGDKPFSDDFHVFAVEWEPNEIRWYVDGNHYSTKTPADISGKTWVFDHGFFIILNLAVGGEWPGNPDDTTVFPQKLVVDYINVCQK